MKRRRYALKHERANNPTFDGLELNRTGEYVKIDDVLLSRLGENLSCPVNPFENCKEYIETMRRGTPLSLDFLEDCSEIRKTDHESVKLGEMVANFPVDWLALKRSEMKEDNWDYSVKMPINPRVADQYHTGRCWLMSSLNKMRYDLMAKLNIEYKFEFSETYLYFYDKIERANLFLEYMWTFRKRNLEDREVRLFTNPGCHFLDDGGTFPFFLNLVKKYGIVPKNVYNETYNSMTSGLMNESLISILNQMAFEIFENSDWTREQFEEAKEQYMSTFYDLVVKFLGEPPKPTDTFTWTYKTEHGETVSVPNMTAEKFYRVIIPHENDTKMVIINDPRHPENYYMNSWGEYSLNMLGGLPMPMINLPMDDFKKVICESLKNQEACWFGADIGKCFDYESNTSDTKRFDYQAILGTDTQDTKENMLDMLTSVPNHAMVFNGVDTIEDPDGNVTGYKKWRVENSWGLQTDLESAEDYGYYRMTDEYVDKYVYMAVVDLKYFDQDTIGKIMENVNQGKSFTYSPYDSFGTLSLRQKCFHCHERNIPKRPGVFKK